jgi:hypothetical protein
MNSPNRGGVCGGGSFFTICHTGCHSPHGHRIKFTVNHKGEVAGVKASSE